MTGMREIALIDVSDFLAGREAATAARAMDEAASSVGFLQVVGHGIPRDALDPVYDAMDRLHELPEEEKCRLLSGGHVYRGFHMNRDSRGRVRQERFLVSRFDDPEDAVRGGVPGELADFFFPNVWPDVEGLRDAVGRLFALTNALAARLMSLVALALGSDASRFDGMLEPNASTFAVNHYPPRMDVAGDDEPPLLFAEHSDGNTLTLLHQRGSYVGLQVQPLGQSDVWIDAPPIEEAFVVNVGELLTRWTNDRWPATKHRVVPPEGAKDHRTTLTTFHMPALDAVVAPLDVCGGVEDPHYGPVTPYEWERAYITRSYRRSPLQVDPKVEEFVESLRH